MKITQTRKLLDYADFVDFSPLFIETGSAAGDGIQRAIDAGFHRIKSIEAMPKYYNICADRFEHVKSVQMFLGQSIDWIEPVIRNLNYPAVFFLDAHPAGPGTAGHEEILSGNEEFGQDYIITKELEVILAHRNDHLIIIDDLTYGSDEDARYMKMCLKVNPNYTFEYYDEHIGQFRENKILVCRP